MYSLTKYDISFLVTAYIQIHHNIDYGKNETSWTYIKMRGMNIDSRVMNVSL